jgi:hypothetical protein
MVVDLDDRSNQIMTQRFVSVQAGSTHYNRLDFNVHLYAGYIVCTNRRAVPNL